MESPNNEADRASTEHLLSPSDGSSSGNCSFKWAVGQRDMRETSNNLDCCQVIGCSPQPARPHHWRQHLQNTLSTFSRTCSYLKSSHLQAGGPGNGKYFACNQRRKKETTMLLQTLQSTMISCLHDMLMHLCHKSCEITNKHLIWLKAHFT